MTSSREEQTVATVIGVVTSIAVAGLLVPARGVMGNTNVALVLVIVIVGAAAFGGRIAGIVTALAAAVSFNFFHTQPYRSLKVADGEDIWSIALLVVVGLVVGELARLGRSRQVQAVRQRDGARRLERIGALVAGGASMGELWPEVVDALQDELHVARVRIERGDLDPALVVMDRAGRFPVREMHWTHEGMELPRDGVAVPLSAGGRHLATLVLDPTPGRGTSIDQRRVALAIADQLALALSREQGADPRAGGSPWPTSS